MIEAKPSTPRKAFRKAGKIQTPAGLTVSCVVMNVDQSGATLFFENLPELPEKFGLRYGGAEPHIVRIVRREGKTVAVAFDATAESAGV